MILAFKYFSFILLGLRGKNYDQQVEVKGRCSLNIRKNFLTIRAAQKWKNFWGLPTESGGTLVKDIKERDPQLRKLLN